MQDEVLHLRHSSLDGFMGRSPIAICRETVGLGIAQQKHGAAVMKNGLMASGLITTSEWLDEAKGQVGTSNSMVVDVCHITLAGIFHSRISTSPSSTTADTTLHTFNGSLPLIDVLRDELSPAKQAIPPSSVNTSSPLALYTFNP